MPGFRGDSSASRQLTEFPTLCKTCADKARDYKCPVCGIETTDVTRDPNTGICLKCVIKHDK
jgi:hypothetical protein